MNALLEMPEITPEDLLWIPDCERFELVAGRLVERVTNTWAAYVAGELCVRLSASCRAKGLGWTFTGGASLQCFPNAPKNVRRADVCYYSFKRLSLAQVRAEGHLLIAPDLAAEIVSPNESTYEIDEKVEEYRSAGVRLIWVINPVMKIAYVHRLQGVGTILRANDELDGEDVIPGFRCRVDDLCDPPGVAATA